MTSSQTRRFHLGDILTITTEILVSPRHMDGVYDICNFMTGDNLMTHQLPRASGECKPSLLGQHPDLADIQVPDFSAIRRDRVEVWVAEWLGRQVAKYGEYRDVTPLADGEHTVINPLQELAMNYPHLTVLPIVLPDEGGELRG